MSFQLDKRLFWAGKSLLAKFSSLIVVYLFLCPVLTCHAESLPDLYRERRYEQIVGLLEHLNPAEQNEESLYFLALSLVKMKKYTDAKSVLESLLSTDPSFYSYKILQDWDLVPELDKLGLRDELVARKSTSVINEFPATHHQLVRNENGLFLYRNGVKLILPVQGQVVTAGFLSESTVYYLSFALAKSPRQLSIYFAPRRALVYNCNWSSNSVVVKLQGDKIIVYSSEDFAVFSKEDGRNLIACTAGHGVQIDSARHVIVFTQKDSKSNASTQHEVQY